MNEEVKGKEEVKWYLRPIAVIVLLFFVLGPLALPLLYKSPQFTRTWKVFLTFAVIAYTVYLIIVSVRIFSEAYKMLESLQQM